MLLYFSSYFGFLVPFSHFKNAPSTKCVWRTLSDRANGAADCSTLCQAPWDFPQSLHLLQKVQLEGNDLYIFLVSVLIITSPRAQTALELILTASLNYSSNTAVNEHQRYNAIARF